MNYSCLVPPLLIDGQWPTWTGSQVSSSLLISGQWPHVSEQQPAKRCATKGQAKPTGNKAAC